MMGLLVRSLPKYWLLCLIFWVGWGWGAEVRTLEQLIESIRAEGLQENRYQQERLQRFMAERQRQRQRMEEITTQVSKARARADALRSRFEANEKQLAELDTHWREQAGDMEELFSQAGQDAVAVRSLLEGSLVNSQKPGRLDFLEPMTRARHQPTLTELRKLWHVLLDEIGEAGRVVRFQAPVISPSGEQEKRQIVRVGVFNAFHQGRYLRYIDGSDKLLMPLQQPPRRHRKLAAELERATSGWHPVALDPSRGALLALMIQSPDIRERLRQGGIIGYFILALGLIGLGVALVRYLFLILLERRIERQHQNLEPDPVNPVGRLRQALENHRSANQEALAVFLEEVTQAEIQRLYRGLPAINLFATIAPLLGLLGTVTGMIETFDAIALFGTGDPKLMSGGISQALVTTQLGLAVAVPLLLIYSFLRSRAEGIASALTEESVALFEHYSQEGSNGAA